MKRKLFIPVILLALVSIACSQSGQSPQLPEVQVSLFESLPTLQVTLPAGDADAAATLAVNMPAAEELKQQFSTLKPDENGNFSVTVTDDQVNKAMSAGLSAAENLPTPVPAVGKIANPVVLFTAEAVVFEADIVQPSGHLKVEFRPYVQDGALQFEVISADFGGRNVPAPLLGTAETTMNQTMAEAMSDMPQGAELQSILLGDGTLSVFGRLPQE